MSCLVGATLEMDARVCLLVCIKDKMAASLVLRFPGSGSVVLRVGFLLVLLRYRAFQLTFHGGRGVGALLPLRGI